MRFSRGSILGLVILLSLAAGYAAPVGASVTVGSSETYSPTVTNTVNAIGGNVTEVNVSSVQVTDKWAGFYGQVSGSVVLADSSGNYFYQWTISDPTGGVVYVANNTVSSWTLSALRTTSGYLPSHLLQGTDSFNNTFTQHEDFNSPSISVTDANYTTTWQGGTQGTEFKTYALYADSGATLIWAGTVNADKTSFNSGSADYQVLAGMDAQATLDTFYFYLELP